MSDTDRLDASNWDLCDEHETTFYRGSFCKDCRIESLQAKLDAVKKECERWHDHKEVSADSMCRISQILEVQ